MESGEKQSVRRKVHYVASRYKQAAEKASAQSSNSREKSTFFKVSGNSQQRSRDNYYDAADCSKFSVCQEGSRGMTSTPTSKAELTFPLLDASVVPDVKEHPVPPHLKEGIGPITSGNLKRKVSKKNKFLNETTFLRGPVVVSYGDGREYEHYNEKVTEAHIDIMYAEYLQAAFLDMETKKALQMRSECALEKIHKLCSLVMLHMNKLQHEQSQTKIISFFLKALRHAQKQEEIYKPLFDIMPSLEKQYRSLADAVNATKHKLLVKGVLLPDPGSESEVIELLDETNNAICEFFKKFVNAKEICASAEILQTYVDVGEKISDSLKRGLELLAEAQDFMLSEASLELSRVNL